MNFDAFLGAIVGGVFTLAGAYLTQVWQQRKRSQVQLYVTDLPLLRDRLADLGGPRGEARADQIDKVRRTALLLGGEESRIAERLQRSYKQTLTKPPSRNGRELLAYYVKKQAELTAIVDELDHVLRRKLMRWDHDLEL